MTFKGSLFSKVIIAGDIKRFWWVGALYALALFLSLPFDHIMKMVPPPDKWVGEMLRNSLNILSGAAGLQVLLICTVPVALAVLLFQYLHNSKATAALHSLPLSRKHLFLSHTAAGLMLLLIPVIANGLVLLLLNAATLLKLYYTPADILRWVGMSALLDTLTFAFAAFMGMFTGNAAAQIIFTYILQLLPSGLNILLSENLSHLVYGYVANPTVSLRYNFPLLLLSGSSDRAPFTAGTAAVYLLATALFLAAALFVYRLRPAEAAGEVVAFPVLRPVFKYGVTACTMLLAGAYFAAVYRGNPTVIYLGYAVGSLVGYLTAEALLQKSLKVWSSYKGYLVYAAVVAVLLMAIATDVTGYVRRVPDPEDVKDVYYGPYAYPHYTIAIEDRDADFCVFKNRSNIEKIVLLHRQLLKAPRREGGSERYIAYTLKDGTHLVRRYTFEEKDYASLLKPVYESWEYKRSRFPIVTQHPDEIKLIEIGDRRSTKKPMLLADREEIAEFAASLRRDVLALTFEDLTTDSEENIYADIVDTAGHMAHYSIRSGYSSVMGWLKGKGYYDQIALLPSEIEYAFLTPSKHIANTPSKQVEIRDSELIEELLNVYGTEKGSAGEAVDVTFYIRRGEGAFAVYQRSIRMDWPLSEKLRKCLDQLD